MCSDLISRQDVLDAVNDCGICIQRILDIPSAELETFEFCSGGDNPCKEYDQDKHCCHRWTKVIRQTVEEMKSVEPERKTGHWTGDCCSCCGVSKYNYIKMVDDECGPFGTWNFCPSCGADMRGDR